MKLAGAFKFGLWLNAWLLVMVLGTALLLVRWQYESRRLYVQLEKSEALGQQLTSENARALADKRALAAPARIERVATQILGMKPADASVTFYLNAASSAGAKP